MRLARSGPRPNSALWAVLAILGAASLALYLQHRALVTLQLQHDVILRQMAEQTAATVVADVRRTLEGPVFDTLTKVNHPQLREGRLDLVAREYEAGLREYPQVERFFLWSTKTAATLPGEMVFYGRAPRRGFFRDTALGQELLAIADRHADSQQIYVAAHGLGPQRRYDAFLRLFWNDAGRTRYFAVLGFVVDPATVRRSFFGELHRRRLGAMLRAGDGQMPARMRVIDETGATVFGDDVASPVAARVSFPLLFYPAQAIQSRLAAGIEPVQWTIEVQPPAIGSPAAPSGGYWMPLISVALMLLAMVFTVRAHRRSTQLARIQADFISHVSHQLKTPLSLVSAATETLEMERVRSPEKLAQYLSIIRSEVARLSALVQRILEFSRVQQRRGFEIERLDLSALVRETVDAFQRSLSGHRFTFHVDQRGPAPVVDADPAALEQVLVNLLDNAVKYSDAERQVTVTIGRSGADAVIEVRDRGIGIAREERERIFEKFFRGTGASVHRQGFGLGLSIAQELVAAHRGRMEVESLPGEGSTFRVRLPAAATLEAS